MIAAFTNHLWQSTIFVLAVALVAAALRGNGAHIRHRLWFVASMKFLVPFSLLMSLGGSLPRFTPAAPAAMAESVPDLSIAVDQITQPFTGGTFVFSDTTSHVGVSGIAWLLAGVWASGFLAVVGMRVRGWRRVRAALRTSVSVPITAPVPVRPAPGLLEPGVVGFWHPVLLVPEGIERRLTPKQFEAVLLHEWCHVQRRDNLTSAIHMVVEAVFWFHPLVWFVGARLVDERERACDEYVLRTAADPTAYAESILSVCKLYVDSPVACVSGVTGSDLKKRVAAILINRVGHRLNFARKTALILAAVLAVALPVIAGILIAPVRASALAAAQGGGAQTSVSAPGSAGASRTFDVVSIKPCAGIDQRPTAGRGAAPSSAQTSPGYAYWDCVSLVELIEQAYASGDQPLLNLGPNRPANPRDRFTSASDDPQRIRGGPSWVRSDRFTIEVKASADTISPQPGQRNLRNLPVAMSQALRALLEDRFQLKVRRHQESQPMYALSVASAGLKADRVAPGSCVPWTPEMGRGAAQPWSVIDPPVCGGIYTGYPEDKLARVLAGEDSQTVAAAPGPNRRMEFTAVTLPEVVKHLSSVMDHLVLDHLTIQGEFTFAIEYEKDERTPGGGLFVSRDWKPTASPQTKSRSIGRGATIFKALEQLGLKLELTKGPSEYLVIDSVQRPRPDPPASAEARSNGGAR